MPTPGSSPPRHKSASASPPAARPIDDANATTDTALTAVLEADEFDSEQVLDDGDSAIGSFHSSTMSMRDELISQVKEHGRQYTGYMGAKYVLPMDEQEIERLDFQCHLVWLTLDKQQNWAPLKDIRRALDVGCGTGMWTIDFADAHPETDVLGVDLAPVQPLSVPPNLSFEIDDLEQPWNFTHKFDYIHCQLMIGAFQDWLKFFRQSFEFLETDGYLEVHDIDFVIKCDDGTLPDDSALVKWHDHMHEAAKTAGFPLDAIGHVPEMMREAGFVDIVATPVKWPINPWPKTAKYKELGRWAQENFTWGCDSMSLALFTRVLGWSADEVHVFMAMVRQDLRNRKLHAYWNFWVVHGRKPPPVAGLDN
ncbi:S-adenosyl-L-methionine-dependent methyltransferase [Apodospora peruviana]|uniref:S-adenosyl-L-methionine-dependent methyltransferase n=1 Tax=Apodospora peruviana TaxID=516989 RepID=A0AAE0MBH1_9PEZI|nr:S-adenosyl-L-methionine-dependent methyltransferase [Apodospora peruviana]